jgi:hypothetical protein
MSKCIIVRWFRQDVDLRGKICSDPAGRSKIAFLAGYRPETAGTWQGQLPADGSVWVVDVDRDTKPDDRRRGALIVRLVRPVEWKLEPIGLPVRGIQDMELRCMDGPVSASLADADTKEILMAYKSEYSEARRLEDVWLWANWAKHDEFVRVYGHPVAWETIPNQEEVLLTYSNGRQRERGCDFFFENYTLRLKSWKLKMAETPSVYHMPRVDLSFTVDEFDGLEIRVRDSYAFDKLSLSWTGTRAVRVASQNAIHDMKMELRQNGYTSPEFLAQMCWEQRRSRILQRTGDLYLGIPEKGTLHAWVWPKQLVEFLRHHVVEGYKETPQFPEEYLPPGMSSETWLERYEEMYTRLSTEYIHSVSRVYSEYPDRVIEVNLGWPPSGNGRGDKA